MKYMMLLVGSDEAFQRLPEAERSAIYQRIVTWWGEHSQKGKIGEGYQLQPARTATTVTISNGKATVTDGPFLEAKETIGGYGILNVANLDEAVAIAKTWPAGGKVEVRPVVEREGM